MGYILLALTIVTGYFAQTENQKSIEKGDDTIARGTIVSKYLSLEDAPYYDTPELPGETDFEKIFNFGHPSYWVVRGARRDGSVGFRKIPMATCNKHKIGDEWNGFIDKDGKTHHVCAREAKEPWIRLF